MVAVILGSYLFGLQLPWLQLPRLGLEAANVIARYDWKVGAEVHSLGAPYSTFASQKWPPWLPC